MSLAELKAGISHTHTHIYIYIYSIYIYICTCVCEDYVCSPVLKCDHSVVQGLKHPGNNQCLLQNLSRFGFPFGSFPSSYTGIAAVERHGLLYYRKLSANETQRSFFIRMAEYQELYR